MKKKNSIIILILLVLVGCRVDNKQAKDELIIVDVTAKYPYKELILQDFMDVEYIPLETNEEFLCQANVWAIGNKVIIATNFNLNGDIFFFNRDGKALKKINRKGQGSEEYSLFTRIVLDEENNEIFVNDMYTKKY